MKQSRFEPGNFIVVPNKHILRSMSANAKLVFLALCIYADDTGLCFPSRRTLAEDASVSLRTIDRALNELVDMGIISRTNQKDAKGALTSNIYQLHIVPSVNFEPQDAGGVAPHSRYPTATQTPPSDTQAHRTITKELNHTNSLSKDSGAEAPETFGNPVINEMIEIFEQGLEVKLKKVTQQRRAAWRLIRQLGEQKALAACRAAVAVKDQQYAPVISDILDLDQKLGKLILFYRKNQPKNVVASV